jgi:glutamate-1-semialdehyde 2,1-aminomutase
MREERPATDGARISWLERAKSVLPGGVSSPVRSFRSVGQELLIASEAKGAYVQCFEQRFVDYIQSFGALFAGHAHPSIVQAIQEAAPLGTSYGLTSRNEIELAEQILLAIPWCKRVRFVNSGTEAVMTAVRLARGVTGRRLVLRFDGCYHGHSDSMLVKAGSGVHAIADSSSAGVPRGLVSDTVIVPLGDLDAVEEAVGSRGRELAAILVEPVPANSGLLLQEDGFLPALREMATRCGALLIFDEVITGFRVARGGASELFGVTPDLVTLGKLIGGGMPVGAVSGPAELLEQLAPLGPVYQAGTLSGNPVAMAAGLASLALAMDPAERAKLEANARGLQKALEPVCAKAPFPLRPLTYGNMFWLWPSAAAPARRPDQVGALEKKRFNALHARLRAHGVLLAPSLFEVGFVTTAHDARVAAETAAALERALQDLAKDPSLTERG